MLSEFRAGAVDGACTERKSANKLLTLVRAILMFFKGLAEWAWEELNFRPHAYQAFRLKGWKRQVRKLVELRNARLRANSGVFRSQRSQIRRQGVDKNAGGDESPRSFQTFGWAPVCESNARSIRTRKLTDRELLSVALMMRTEGVTVPIPALLAAAALTGCSGSETAVGLRAVGLLLMAGSVLFVVIYGIAWAADRIFVALDNPWSTDDEGDEPFQMLRPDELREAMALPAGLARRQVVMESPPCQQLAPRVTTSAGNPVPPTSTTSVLSKAGS